MSSRGTTPAGGANPGMTAAERRTVRSVQDARRRRLLISNGDGTTSDYHAFYTPQMFGAKANGVADDTKAISDAIAAADADGVCGVYLPPGVYLVGKVTVPGARHEFFPFQVPSGFTLAGAGPEATIIRSAANGAGYETMFLQSGEATGIVFRDLTFDQNATNNQGQKIKLIDPTGYGFGILVVQGATNVTVRNCEFRDVFGINTVVFGGVGATVKGVRVADCLFSSNPIGATQYDNSTVYFDCWDHHFIGNVMTGRLTGTNVSIGAIETHGGPSNISGNTISTYCVGLNAVDGYFSDYSAGTGIGVHGNSFRGCNNGILLWASPGKVHRGTKVSGNLIVLDDVTFTPPNFFGIAFVPQAPGLLTGDYDRIEISGNTITFATPDHTVLEGYIAGIGCSPSAPGKISNLVVKGNTIIGCPAKGIALDGEIDHADVSGNTIIDAGCSAYVSNPDFRCAIFGGGFAWSNLAVRDNVIIDTGDGAARGRVEAYLQPADGSARVEYTNNRAISKNPLIRTILASRVRQSPPVLFQSFLVGVNNAGGTIKHIIQADLANAVAPLWCAADGAEAAWNATPRVTAGVGFSKGAGIDDATPSILVFDVPDQVVGYASAAAFFEFSSAGAANLRASAQIYQSNVGGVTKYRLAVQLIAGAGAWDITPANLIDGQTIYFRVQGMLTGI